MSHNNEAIPATSEQVEQSPNGASSLEGLSFEEMKAQRQNYQHKTLYDHLEYLQHQQAESDNLERQKQINEEIEHTKKLIMETDEGKVLNVEGLKVYTDEDRAADAKREQKNEVERQKQIELYKQVLQAARSRQNELVDAGKDSEAKHMENDINQAREDFDKIVNGVLIDNGDAPLIDGMENTPHVPTQEELAKAENLKHQHQVLYDHLDFLQHQRAQSDNLEKRARIDAEIARTKEFIMDTDNGKIINVEGLEVFTDEDRAAEAKSEQIHEDKRVKQIELYKQAIEAAENKYDELIKAGKERRAENLRIEIKQAREDLRKIQNGTLMGNGDGPSIPGVN